MKMGSMIVSVLKTCHGCHVATISHGAMLPLQILQVGIHYKCQMGKTIRPDLCCSLCFILHVLRLLENHICTRVFAQTERKLRGRGTPHTEGPQKHLECCGSGEWFPCSFKGKKARTQVTGTVSFCVDVQELSWALRGRIMEYNLDAHLVSWLAATPCRHVYLGSARYVFCQSQWFLNFIQFGNQTCAVRQKRDHIWQVKGATQSLAAWCFDLHSWCFLLTMQGTRWKKRDLWNSLDVAVFSLPEGL